jgi:hypothetical protein
VSLSDRLRRAGAALGGRPHADGASELHVGDPRFDDWDVVEEFEDLGGARALRQRLQELGQEAVITSDWPLDRFGRGDIAIRVPPGEWADADGVLSEPDD